MQRLPLFYIKPGMKTFEEVIDPNGRVLCGKGIELTEEHIEKFKEFGVKYVTVEGTPVKLSWEKSLEEELKALEIRFKNVKDEHMLTLKNIIKEVLLEKYKKDK